MLISNSRRQARSLVKPESSETKSSRNFKTHKHHRPRRPARSPETCTARALASGTFEAASASPSQGAEQAAPPDCDVLIKGGTVIDPGQNLHAPLDVAVKDGKILELSPDIAPARAVRVVSAKGTIVTPGLIDVHVHVFEGVGPTGLNADQYCLGRGVTTAVDAGSTGYFSIAGFRQYVIKPSATRIFAMVDIE